MIARSSCILDNRLAAITIKPSRATSHNARFQVPAPPATGLFHTPGWGIAFAIVPRHAREADEAIMKLIKNGAEWHLIDEHASPDACLIARLHGELEAAALIRFCEYYLAGALDDLRRPFPIEHAGKSYTVSTKSRKGEKLVLRIIGTDETDVIIQTEFVL